MLWDWTHALGDDIPISQWLWIITILLSLTIIVGKRKSDQLSMKTNLNTRPVYSERFLNAAIIGFTSLTGLTYLFYTLYPNTVDRYGNHLFWLTSLPVFIALIRFNYVHLILKETSDPMILWRKDYVILGSIILWVGLLTVMLYG